MAETNNTLQRRELAFMKQHLRVFVSQVNTGTGCVQVNIKISLNVHI